MKIAVLSTTVCPLTNNVINYFKNKDLNISLVIIENSIRHNLTPAESKFRNTHDKYNMKHKKYNPLRRAIRRLWDLLPKIFQDFIILNIKYFPFLNIFSVEKKANKENIEVLNVKRHSSKKTRTALKARNINYVLLLSSNWLIKDELLSIKETDIINIHPGELPRHRGLDSLPWSITVGDRIGYTAYFLDEGIDTGPILKFYEEEIKPGNTIGSIMKRFQRKKPELFYDVLMKLKNNQITPSSQKEKYKIHRPMNLSQLEDADKLLQKKINKL